MMNERKGEEATKRGGERTRMREGERAEKQKGSYCNIHFEGFLIILTIIAIM